MSISLDNIEEKKSVSVCPVCLSGEVTTVFAINQVPVHCNLLWDSRDAALRAPRGDIYLGQCKECGHLYNQAFDQTKMVYSQTYENALDFSTVFREYMESLADRLIENYGLYQKKILEVGCGQGEFLKLLCDLGQNNGIGFDPGYRPVRGEDDSSGNVQFIQDFYNSEYAHISADFFCSRHVLEHLRFPRQLLDSIRQATHERPDAVLYLEVPNVLYTLRDLGIWDLIYEHFSYFSPQSLAYLVESCGFEIGKLEETYQGQFLNVEAQPKAGKEYGAESILDPLFNLVKRFSQEYIDKVKYWRESLDLIVQRGQRVAAWGAGSKGVTFLNVIKPAKQIPFIVDINPRKQGCYVAGSGQQVVEPDFLLSYKPDVIVVLNPVYVNEIQETVDHMGLQTDFLVA